MKREKGDLNPLRRWAGGHNSRSARPLYNTTLDALDRLEKHVAGKLELSPTQVQAAQILLKKILPDLAAVDSHVTGQMTQHFVRAPAKMESAEWSELLQRRQAAAELAAPKPKQPALAPKPNGNSIPKLN